MEPLSKKQLQDKVASWADPFVLSPANLRVGLRQKAQIETVRLLGVVSGNPPDFALTKRFRYWTHLQEFVGQRAAVRGRRALHISLPPVWDEQGIYQVLDFTDSGALRIRHRFNDIVAEVPQGKLPLGATGTNPADYYVHENWSEWWDAVSHKSLTDHDKDCTLANDFREQEVSDEGMPQPRDTPLKRKLCSFSSPASCKYEKTKMAKNELVSPKTPKIEQAQAAKRGQLTDMKSEAEAHGGMERNPRGGQSSCKRKRNPPPRMRRTSR